MRPNRACCVEGVVRFALKQEQISICDGFRIAGGVDSHSPLAAETKNQQSGLPDRIDMVPVHIDEHDVQTAALQY